jgi:hypothetical protein
LFVYPGVEQQGFAWGGLSEGLPHFLQDQRPGGFLGAAVPARFAPTHDEIMARVFEPPEPTSATMRVWGKARQVAEKYWQALTKDERITAGFRSICAACLSTLNSQPRTGAYAYKG